MIGRTVIHEVSNKRYLVVGFCMDVSPNDNNQYPSVICADSFGRLRTYFLSELMLELSENERRLLK